MKVSDFMLSKDIQQWNWERQIQELAATQPQGKIASICFEHKGKYSSAAAMSAACRVYYLFRCVYEQGFQLHGNIPGLLDIVYLVQGSLLLSYAGNESTLSAGDLVLLQHNEHAFLRQNSADPVEIILIRCTGELPDNFYRMLLRQGGIVHSTENGLICDACDELLYYIKYPADAANTRLALIMTQLFSNLLVCAIDRTAPKHPQWFVTVIDYIEAHYKEEITVEQLSNLTKISTPHFHRLFLDYTGFTPYQYLLIFRVEKAKLLLTDPVLQVKQIGKEVGFNHVNHFIQHFKRITGLTPGEYRAGRLHLQD